MRNLKKQQLLFRKKLMSSKTLMNLVNEIWSNISVSYDKHFQHGFDSIMKTGN